MPRESEGFPLPQGGSGALQVLRGFSPCSTSHPPSQRPVLGFHTDPYVRLPVTGKVQGRE